MENSSGLGAICFAALLGKFHSVDDFAVAVLVVGVAMPLLHELLQDQCVLYIPWNNRRSSSHPSNQSLCG